MWSAKGLDDKIDLKNGSYGDVGTLYDSVEIGTLAPPFVDASNAANGAVSAAGISWAMATSPSDAGPVAS